MRNYHEKAAARPPYMLRKPFVLVFIRFGCWRGIMGNCYENSPRITQIDTDYKNNKKNVVYFLLNPSIK
jgi:hypothetical protein